MSLALTALVLLARTLCVSAPRAEPDRSPSDLALSRDGRWAVTANTTSDTVSLVDVAGGRVVAETPAGRAPFGVALARDGRHAVVTDRDGDSVTLLDVAPAGLKAVGTFPVGDEPRGVALSADGARAFVALSGEDALAVVDLKTQRVLTRLPVGVEPWHVALSPDGRRLAVGNARSQDVTVLDTATLKVLHTVRLRGRNVRHLAVSPDGAWAYVPHIAERGRPVTQDNIDNGWVVGNRLSRAPLIEEGPRESIALDPRGKAVGDVDGVALRPDGNLIALTAGGTHELLLLPLPLPFLAYGGPGDHIDPALLSDPPQPLGGRPRGDPPAPQAPNDPKKLRRVPLGGRPLGVQFAPDGKTVVVANYLSNCLQVVDVQQAQVVKTIALGGPAVPSLARRGEALFLDADRSFHHWYSCNTCHVEGHTNGGTFDTLNDGSYDTPKKTLSLRGVAQTGPWTWHGWQKSLRQLVHDSSVKSMQGPEPTEAELDALMAYLATLDFRPNPRRNAVGALADVMKRGEAVFTAKGCGTCHAPPNYTTPAVYIVGLESPQDVYKGFNPPTLRGIYNRAPYLHAGQARSLEEVLTKYHRPSQLTGRPDLTPQELSDLVAFLKSL
jgi:YVTN family beta-propeller protein